MIVHAEHQELPMTDVHELLEAQRHQPDVRRAGHECTSPDCRTRIYIVGRTHCRQCERRAVNTSHDQRDSGRFRHTSTADVA